VISQEEIPGLGELWERVLGLIPATVVTDWRPLLNAIRGVASPQILGGNPGHAFHAACDDLARRSVGCLTRVAATRPGVMLELRDIASWLGAEFKAEIDLDFDTIYPHEDFKDHDAWFKKATEQARELGVRLAARPASEIARLLTIYGNEATQLPKAFPTPRNGLRYSPIL
jgi:hypothetical protein